ncbi:MAG TPA: TonB-dependent receptor, partial [Thermoanaerobaculia bacterium]|nr:TonB-dependent receptor [Thermoanaerobaculia bacterium]
MSRLRFCLAFFSLLFCTSLIAQTTGNLTGRVTDSNGGALPGVTIEVKSPALQGTRSISSDRDGTYRFALLPPGDYAVTFRLEGLAPEARKNVTVSLGKDTSLDVTMRPAAVSAEIVVSATAPVLDTTSTTLGTNLNTRAIETLPSGRNYASVVQVTPGVASDANPGNAQQSTISVYGSSGAENSFFIDGVNTTNVEYGFQGKELNFEFISEVDVKTGGYEAEYGRSTGGIINVITKSGGNDFRGDLFGYHDSDSLQSNAKSVVSTAGTQEGFTRKDYGVDVG